MIHLLPGRDGPLEFGAAVLSERELLASWPRLVMLPSVLNQALLLQPLEQWVERPAFDSLEAVLVTLPR